MTHILVTHKEECSMKKTFIDITPQAQQDLVRQVKTGPSAGTIFRLPVYKCGECGIECMR